MSEGLDVSARLRLRGGGLQHRPSADNCLDFLLAINFRLKRFSSATKSIMWCLTACQLQRKKPLAPNRRRQIAPRLFHPSRRAERLLFRLSFQVRLTRMI